MCGSKAMMDRSRREFLKTSAGVAGLCIGGSSAAVRALGAESIVDASGQLEPFPLASVRLAPGIFRDQEEINARYLDSLVVDRLLHILSRNRRHPLHGGSIQRLGGPDLRIAWPFQRRPLSFRGRAGLCRVRQCGIEEAWRRTCCGPRGMPDRKSEPAI